MNFEALSVLFPDINLGAIEINEAAVEVLRNKFPKAEILNESIIEFKPKKKWDLVLIKGVLIHINPDYLDNVYQNLVNGSNRYVLVAEYYNPSPTQITYYGHQNKLFKRDFAGDLIDGYGLKLIDYGFIYKRDNWAPQDDITWFLLEK